MTLEAFGCRVSAAVALALVLSPVAAFAHQETGQAAGLLAGLSHPLSGLDHVLAMIAVGLWGAVLGPPAIWVLPVAFPMVMAFGGLMGLLGFPLPGVEIGIAVSAVVLGALVLAGVRPPLWLAALIVAFFAIFHGHAHGRELPEGTSALLYSLGYDRRDDGGQPLENRSGDIRLDAPQQPAPGVESPSRFCFLAGRWRGLFRAPPRAIAPS